jgi:hypothetical protein
MSKKRKLTFKLVIKVIFYVLVSTLYKLGTFGIGISAMQVIRDNMKDPFLNCIVYIGIIIWMLIELFRQMYQDEVNAKCIK